MKHIIFGGNGFVGRYTARDLVDAGDEVLVCDIAQDRELAIYQKAGFQKCDITRPEDVARVPIGPDDVVYNLAARMLHPIIKRRARYEYFYSVDYHGAVNIVEAMERAGCNRLIQFSTDMVYGPLQTPPPVRVDHPRVPIGEYSASKKALEDYCIAKRADGLRVSIFRPRLINGPGRVGILGMLFNLIRMSLPVPLIGNGRNRYQMVSVFDCASAAVCSARKGVVNGEFNLGSTAPPDVRTLLAEVIREAGSKSILVPTIAAPAKVLLRALDRINLPILVPEQFEIADHDYVVDIEPTIHLLDWMPRHSDQQMMNEAYRQFLLARNA
ncbi:NAD-dependent epimerase/dehydratase family protein [Rivibacter subsaxonicus]|uniref:dTDP-glucose 4,6-dehydratase n=1 Tax=Rivibacter subsaxonicus TaxID=457575 RepID=A0A4Q7W0G1_9BURK|nr:NAD(P)-dependent oxidoreductase [Rivibacter subsaxonicus]RZU02657.1 dTDP-glucose 4,6-dehydratase [Rivibacter subsaxonicus]